MAKERNLSDSSAPNTGERERDDSGAATAGAASVYSPPAPKQQRAVLASGPPEMRFCGRLWQHGQPQPVTPEEWAAMQQRGATKLGFTMTLTEEN